MTVSVDNLVAADVLRVPFDAVYGFQKDQVEDDNESKKEEQCPNSLIVQQQQSLHRSIDRAKGGCD
jgi:hypothetical protein